MDMETLKATLKRHNAVITYNDLSDFAVRIPPTPLYPSPQSLFSLSYRGNYFCCGAADVGSWNITNPNPTNEEDKKRFKELFAAFNWFLTYRAGSHPYVGTTLNERQVYIAEELVLCGWKVLYKFRNWNYGENGNIVSVLGHSRDCLSDYNEWWRGQSDCFVHVR